MSSRLTTEEFLRYQLAMSEVRRATAEQRAFTLELQIKYGLSIEDRIQNDGMIWRAPKAETSAPPSQPEASSEASARQVEQKDEST